MLLKPYTEYKDSGVKWMGKTPNGWIVNKIKDVSSVRISNVDKKSKPNESDVLLCNYTDIYNNEFITSELSFMRATANLEQIKKLSLLKDDVVITKDSESADDIAVPALINEKITNLVCGYHLALIRPNPNLITGNFLLRSLESKKINDQFVVAANGVTRFGISTYPIKNSYIVVPSIAEQEKITSFLDKKTSEIDKTIEKDNKLIKLLKEKKIALINNLVIKGLDRNVKMKDSGVEWLGEIPEHWDMKRLKYNCLVNPSKKKTLSNVNVKVNFLPMEKVSEEGDYDLNSKIEYYKVSSGYTYFENNDILLAKITPCFENGKGALVENLSLGFGFGTTEFHILRCTTESIPKYIFYLTKSHLLRVIGEAFMEGAAGQKRISTDFVKNFKMPTPPLNEQSKIVSFLDYETLKIDSTIKKIEIKIHLMEEFKKSLINHVVSGKVDVREVKV